MRARAYDKRIGVYGVQPVPDGYGGNTSSAPVLISNSWAKMEEGAGNKSVAFGVTDFNDPVLFKVRKRNDLPYNGRNLFLMYKDDKYIIKGIKENGQEVELFCIKSNPVEIPLIGAI